MKRLKKKKIAEKSVWFNVDSFLYIKFIEVIFSGSGNFTFSNLNIKLYCFKLDVESDSFPSNQN